MGMIGSELYYDESLSSLERIYCRLLGVPIVGLRIRARRLQKILPPAAAHVLDAGCGRGVIARILAQRYPAAVVEAVDLDAETQRRNTEIARQMGLKNCQFLCADLAAFESPGKYDLIVSVDNLEHVDDDQGVLSRFFSSMQAGGTLVVHVPHLYRRWPIFRREVNFDVPGHVRPGYLLEDIQQKIATAGFQVMAQGYSYGFLENIANNISYVITGARERNVILYAAVFPFLNVLSWLGCWGQPSFGAGAWVVAKKPAN